MILLNNQIVQPAEFPESQFKTGLSIYEVIRIFKGHAIFLKDNLLRLRNSIKKSNIDIDIHQLRIEDKLNRLIALEHIEEGNIKYVLHLTKDKWDEYIYQIPHHYPTEENYKNGIDTITCEAIRLNPEVKYINNDLRTQTDRLLQEHRVYEIILKDTEGSVTEGSRSNVFFIKAGILYTAPTFQVLPGTARKRVLDICKAHQIPVIEERIKYSDLKEFESAFITGTSPLVLPIRKIDEFSFDPQNNRLREIMEFYFSLLDKFF